MKIAVCGSGSGNEKYMVEKSKELGKEIVKAGNVLLTGGCSGYPYSAVRGAILENGKVICYSPGRDKSEHTSEYGFPFEQNAEYIFTGKGIPGRNLDMVENADGVVILDGKIGTLNEFTIAFALGKKIGVLKSGRLFTLIPNIVEICGNREIIYEDNIKEMVRKLMS